MRRTMYLVIPFILFALAGCGDSGSDGGMSASLSDHPDPLTTGGSDRLFQLQIGSAEDTYSLSELMLTFQIQGETATVLNIELSNDVNSDGLLGTGDTLTAIEPGVDILGTDAIGERISIELMLELGGSRVETLWSGEWQAN